MLIKSRMGISADGFVSTAEGVPTQVTMPEFVPGVSHGFPEFIDGCDAVGHGPDHLRARARRAPLALAEPAGLRPDLAAAARERPR